MTLETMEITDLRYASIPTDAIKIISKISQYQLVASRDTIYVNEA